MRIALDPQMRRRPSLEELPRKTRHAHAELDDPIIVALRAKGGVRIDGEAFVDRRYGYDIQRQVVGEEGVANLPEPEASCCAERAGSAPRSGRIGRCGSSTPMTSSLGLDQAGDDRQEQRLERLERRLRRGHG